MSARELLDSEVESEEITWEQWIKKSLEELLVQGSNFSSKHPLGNSGWDLEFEKALDKYETSVSDIIEELFDTE